MSLFEKKQDLKNEPLAQRMKPVGWDDFVGQEHIIGKGKLLREAIEKDQIPSMIFWGPPGSGKTSLAQLISKITGSNFVKFSAVTSGVKEVRVIVDYARKLLEGSGKKTILFIDEVHRFNKAQQDAFLPYVEEGTIILIGATTENPSFEVNSALLSRCRVFVLEPLKPEDIAKIIDNALKDKKRGLGKEKIKIDTEALDYLIESSQGDARVALNALEFAVQAKKSTTGEKINISKTDIESALQKSPLLYDRAGDEHYNTISAYIKSMRASDIDAALYYLARMVEAGEDPLFIARRIVVFASEDVLSPTALVVANAVFSACQQIGFPECQENLAAGTVYMCQAKKDRSAYTAYMNALADVKKYGSLSIPFSIRNAPTKLMKDLGYGKDYQMYPQKEESLLPDKLKGRKYYVKKS